MFKRKKDATYRTYMTVVVRVGPALHLILMLEYSSFWHLRCQTSDIVVLQEKKWSSFVQ